MYNKHSKKNSNDNDINIGEILEKTNKPLSEVDSSNIFEDLAPWNPSQRNRASI